MTPIVETQMTQIVEEDTPNILEQPAIGKLAGSGIRDDSHTEEVLEYKNDDQSENLPKHRWFDGIPMPAVEPIEKGLLYDRENDERCLGLDGLRLATLAAIRDQETAITREMQAGDVELAQATAECVAGMNRMVSNLEETLCCVVEDVSQLYESQGPQSNDISLRAITPSEGVELLQTKVIPIAEVCENIEAWKEAIGEEVASVINKHQAGTFKTDEEVKMMESKGECQVRRVPGKLVAAIKPPRRYKARLVACGNFLHREKTRKSSTLDRTDLYCSNLDVFSLRIQLLAGIQRGWKAASIDVKTAFLTAPFQAERTSGPEPKPKVIMVKVPKAVTIAGFAPQGSYIQVDKALYGLQESPHSWSMDRDRKLASVKWKGSTGSECVFQQCAADGCIWKVVDSKGEVNGTLGVYVDDLLFMVAQEELEGVIRAVRSIWECSKTVYAEDPGGMAFCGVQIEQKGEELWLHQEKYVEELRKRYPNLQPSAYLPDFKIIPESETPDPTTVKGAQKIIGELTWIAGRTRPDIGYCVNRMSRMTTTAPVFVQTCGKQVIRFLLGTSKLKIKYGPVVEVSSDFTEALPQARSAGLLETFCDASFAQQDGCSQSGVVVLLCGQPIGWLSLRQPFVALSTAEAEVISCCEGVALTQALRPLVEELLGRETTWILLNDNIACNAILSYPAGSWRSRHLRLRSKALQEMISEEIMSVYHIPGRFMVGDLLTKPLATTRVLELLEFMSCETTDINLGKKEKAAKGCNEVSPAVRVIILSVLAVPAKGQGEEQVQDLWDGVALFKWCMIGMILFMILLFLGQNRRNRLQQLRQAADSVLGDANASEDRAEPERGQGSDDPSPYLSSASSSTAAAPLQMDASGGLQMFQIMGFSHALWHLWSVQGELLLRFLRIDEWEVLVLRQTASGSRLPVAAAYAKLRPRPPPEPHASDSEETDSGLSEGSSTSSSEQEAPWPSLHRFLSNSPTYREDAVEDAFEIWLMNNQPHSRNWRDFPFLDRLFDLELLAFEAMVEWYYVRTPPSRRSETPMPADVEGSTRYEDRLINDILERYLYEGRLIRDHMGLIWAAPPARNFASEPLLEQETTAARSSHDPVMSGGASSSHQSPVPNPLPLPRGTRVSREAEIGPSSPDRSGARSSHETPYPDADPTPAEEIQDANSEANTSSNSESADDDSVDSTALNEHDYHVAQAAFVLYMEHLNFDWEQLSPNQQFLYHGMVGRYLQNIDEVD